LQQLYDNYASEGFTVLAFPCNQFGKSEPGSEQEIKSFITQTYGIEFTMFAKVKVNGSDADPLWKYLKASVDSAFGRSIKWNFTKFLVDRSGVPVQRYGVTTGFNVIRKDVEKLLK